MYAGKLAVLRNTVHATTMAENAESTALAKIARIQGKTITKANNSIIRSNDSNLSKIKRGLADITISIKIQMKIK